MKKLFKGLIILSLFGAWGSSKAQTNGCGTPTVLPVNTSCVNTAFAVNWNGTTQTINASCATAGTAYEDGWYQVTGTGNPMTITVSGTNLAYVLAAFTSCAAGELDCDIQAAGNTGSITFPTTNGTTYYIQIQRRSGNANANLSGNICAVSAAGGPANDLCANATSLPCGTTNLAGTTVGSSNIAPGTGCTVSNYGVWYTFTGDGQSTTISSTATGGWDHEMNIASGSCGSLTNVTCQDAALSNGTETYTFVSTLGVTYYVYIAYWSSGGTTTGTFNISRSCTAPGVCTDQTIASLPFNQTGMTTAGFGDDYSSADACGSSYMNGDDYVFDYTPAANETVSITLTNTGTWVGIFVTDGCPDVGTCVASNTNSAGNPSLGCVNLTAGTQYFFTVSTFPSPQSTAFDIDVQTVALAPPANDECTGAIALTVNPDLNCGTVTSATVNDATNSGIAGCVGTADDDVWFSFVATSTVHNFDVQNVVGSSTDMVHEIFSGTCPGGLSSVACSDPDASQFSGFTIGNTYYVRVFTSTGTSCQNTTFDFCVGTPPPPPTNDEPCGALSLNVNNGSCSFQSGVLGTSSTISTGMPAPGCSSLGEDVWYTFTVPASGQVIVDLTPSGGPTDMGMAWYTGPSCNNLNTLIECDDDDSQNGAMPMICHAGASCVVPGDCQQNATLTPGTQVWVRIWEYGGGTFGPFDICAYDPGPPGAPSTCATATVIPGLPYSNSGQTTCCRANTYTTTDGCLSAYQAGEDFMYEYTPAANETVDITLTGTLSWTGLFVTDDCPDQGGVNCVGSATSTTGNPTLCGVNLTGGTTYYFMVDTDPSPDCTPFNINVTAATAPSCGLNYTGSVIAYAPDLNAGTNIALPTDDRFSSSYINLGFNFCFDGFEFTQGLISSNGYLIFDPIGCASNMPTTNAAPGNTSGWSINAAIPNTTNAPRNAIMFPWQDIDPSVGGTIRYQTLGTAPNRRFVVTFDQIPYFSCNSLLFTGQLKLFETTNMIEMHIGNKEICAGWNGGDAILGLHNYNGTTAVLGINYPTNWNATNQAYRFTYNCPGPCIPVLPVSLVEFDGKSYEGYNEIYWSTAEEINNDYFLLERSDDGKTFTALATIDGSGNSSNMKYYSYQHDNPKELEYYRLKQVDFDGKYEYSNIIAINSNKDISVNIYPNPAKDNLYISLNESRDDNYTVIYTNVLGGMSKEQINISEGTNTYLLNEFSNLASGIYFVQIKDGSNEIIKTQKVVKE